MVHILFSFYRFVIEPELQFSPDGKSTNGPIAKFTGLPAGPLLTQNLQVKQTSSVRKTTRLNTGMLRKIFVKSLSSPGTGELDG